MLARYGEGLTFDLLDHWHADLQGRDLQRARRRRSSSGSRCSAATVEHELGSPHRLPTSPWTAPT